MRVGEWVVGVSGQGTEGSGCLKVKGRAANWGGSKLMSFSVLSCPGPLALPRRPVNPPPAPDSPQPTNQPIFLSFFPSHLSLAPLSPRREREKKQVKNCLFLNRPLNLFGLGVIGHLHGEHSEVSAIITGL